MPRDNSTGHLIRGLATSTSCTQPAMISGTQAEWVPTSTTDPRRHYGPEEVCYIGLPRPHLASLSNPNMQ